MGHPDYRQQVEKRQLPTIWRIPDLMWERIRAWLPPEKPAGTPGRPEVSFRMVLDGILYVLRTGCQWKAVPKEFGSGSTVHRRFQSWEEAGIFSAILAQMLGWYDEQLGIGWQWQAADTKMVPAPLGGQETGPNPTDRAKSGTKRHLLIDARGAPLGFHLTGANRHDMKGLGELLGAGLLVARPVPTPEAPQHLCLDKGYDYPEIDTLLSEANYTAHIKRRGSVSEAGIGAPIYPARRWKVERTISWLNNMRKLRIRWEKKACNYRALWLIACALLLYRLIVVLG